jgi:hypothetical protein
MLIRRGTFAARCHWANLNGELAGSRQRREPRRASHRASARASPSERRQTRGGFSQPSARRTFLMCSIKHVPSANADRKSCVCLVEKLCNRMISCSAPPCSCECNPRGGSCFFGRTAQRAAAAASSSSGNPHRLNTIFVCSPPIELRDAFTRASVSRLPHTHAGAPNSSGRIVALAVPQMISFSIRCYASRADHDAPIMPAAHPKSRSEHELRQRVSKGSRPIMIGLTAPLERGDIVWRSSASLSSGRVIFRTEQPSSGAFSNAATTGQGTAKDTTSRESHPCPVRAGWRATRSCGRCRLCTGAGATWWARRSELRTKRLGPEP